MNAPFKNIKMRRVTSSSIRDTFFDERFIRLALSEGASLDGNAIVANGPVLNSSQYIADIGLVASNAGSVLTPTLTPSLRFLLIDTITAVETVLVIQSSVTDIEALAASVATYYGSVVDFSAGNF